ncbi:Mis6-domain-containing protein [Syncephalastrum racemosum]|uniref:Mis6-domain-containing protein n=1 Tax=Syncephalastrum racemosum TaxID=13706 RepID=A0A1X2H3H7_SYNRA|nr:Mis6-domain-containing protein [Syncephalastrum racemosum]
MSVSKRSASTSEPEDDMSDSVSASVRTMSVRSDNDDLSQSEPFDAGHRETDATEVDFHINKHLAIFNAAKSKMHLVQFTKKPDYEDLLGMITKYGLNRNQLVTLFELVVSDKLGAKAYNTLVGHMLPRGTVPEELVIRIFGMVPCREHAPRLVARLLNWVITVYDVLDSRDRIVRLYGVLMHYLDMEGIRSQLCHLLYFMTKRVHVKPYRVSRIYNLIHRVGPARELCGLLQTYKEYIPSIIVPDAAAGTKSKLVFQSPFPSMMDTIVQIRALWDNEVENDQMMMMHKPELDTSNTNERRKKRRKQEKTFTIPSTATSSTNYGSVNIKDMTTLTTLAENIDKLALPDQMASVLNNRMLQHVLICDPRPSTVMRVSGWLSQALSDHTLWQRRTAQTRETFSDLLQKLVSLCQLTNAHLPYVEDFLEHYLKTWNGVDHTDLILELLTYTKPTSYERLYTGFLKPLYRIFCFSDITWKTRLILCYTNWLQNWLTLNWHEHKQRRNDVAESSEANDNGDDVLWPFQGLSFDIDYLRTIQLFIQHVDRVSILGMELEHDHCVFQHATLSFFELVSSMSIHHDIPEIIMPFAPLVYRCFLSTNAMAVSRICGIVYQYKRAFEENEKRDDDWKSHQSEEYLDLFNSFVMDICNSLWLSTLQDGDRFAFSLKQEFMDAFQEICSEYEFPFQSFLSLTWSATFSGYSRRFMKAKEEADAAIRLDEPVTSDALIKLGQDGGLGISYSDYRVAYLDRLHDLGFRGLYSLLQSCMTSLINRRRLTEELSRASD